MLLIAGAGRICKYSRCGRVFVAKGRQVYNKEFCSSKCRAQHYFKTKYYPTHLAKPEVIEKTCPNCGAQIRVEGRGRGKSRRKYCNDKCCMEFLKRKYRESKDGQTKEKDHGAPSEHPR